MPHIGCLYIELESYVKLRMAVSNSGNHRTVLTTPICMKTLAELKNAHHPTYDFTTSDVNVTLRNNV